MKKPGHIAELGKEGVMRACTDILSVHHIRHFRMNAGDQFGVNETTGKKWRKRGHAKGTPDLLLMLPPGDSKVQVYAIPAWLECKATGGKQGPDQIEFQRAATENSEIYLLIDSPDQLTDWLRRNKVI
jgi:hypothetical protein